MCKTMCTHSQMKAWGLLALRLALGFIFIYAGYSKLGPNHAGASMMFEKMGFPGGGSAGAYFVGLFELAGGIMVLLGVYAKYAATWLSVIMVVAILTVHRGGPVMGYFLPLAVLGGCLALMGCGAGKYRLVKTQCHCKECKNGMSGGGCGGSCGGGSSGGSCCGGSEEKKEEMMK